MIQKIKKFLVTLIFFIIGISTVYASSNKINNIHINIKLDEKGNAKVEEIWDMLVKEGTEVYKPMTNLGKSQISNFQVKEAGKTYQAIDWDVNASFNDKKYKNGLHSISDGYELCWGISNYGNRVYHISYHLSNFVANLTDKQMIYWRLVNQGMDPAPKKVYVVISAPFSFEDTVPVWGYGYKGYAYVKNGKIYMETESSLSKSEYMVLLANFEIDTFKTTNNLTGSFDDWYKKSKEGSYEQDYEQEYQEQTSLLDILIIVLCFFLPFGIVILIVSLNTSNGNGIPGIYDFKNNSKNFKNVNYFRDIPCNKNIYRAYFIATLYGLTKKKTDFFGSNFLKWLNEEKIEIIKTPAKLFKKEENSIRLKDVPDQELENQLFVMLQKASIDNVLEKNEFGKWCSKHYQKVLNWFDDVLKDQKNQLLKEGKLVQTVHKKYKVFNQKIIEIDDSLRQEAEQLAGLKKFLLDFSDMKHKEAIEVHLWKEYLMFAQIFGIADKVAKQFKNLYPDVITDMDYTSVIFVNHISYYGISRVTSARSAAESYNSGGGGFSSGGGGMGSFGGGVGGGTR